MAYDLTVEELKQRLGPVDEKQVKLLVAVSPAQRIRNMVRIRNVILNTWQRRLRKAYPELNDLERCRLMFDWLQKNG